MRLTFEQIKSVAFGYEIAELQGDDIRFFKNTHKQTDAWRALRDVLGDRSQQTSGVRLDFITNSKHIRIETNDRSFELHVDGLFRYRFKNGLDTDICDPYGQPLESARVTLIFPSHARGMLRSVELDDGASLVPYEYSTKLLFIGDSITQGWNSGIDSFSYAWRVSKMLDADCRINGIGGAIFHESTFDSISFQPENVIIAYGTNDFGYYKTTDELREHSSAFFELIKQEYGNSAKNIFVISPIWRADFENPRPMGSFAECRSTVINEATSRGFIHIDGTSLVPPMKEYFQDEFLHPNAEGFSLYAENLMAQLIKYM